jgi:cation:H+ antiporter
VSLLLGVGAFAGGAWLLVEAVEGLVGVLTRWAAAAGLSGLVLAAVVLGVDFEATGAGVSAALDDLPGAALGTSVGACIFLVTVGLGLAAIVRPFALRTPAPALAAPALATALALALLSDGTLTRADGALLLVAFAPLVALLLRARRGARATGPGEEGRRLVLRLVAGLAGLVLGAELLAFGAGRVVSDLGLSETLFGLLVVAAAVSLEEVVLEMVPAHRGHPELSVGNVLGTTVFLLTASLGVIALVRPLHVPAEVRTYHGPALAAGVADGPRAPCC